MINPNQFAQLVLEPALKATGTYSLDAMYLMLCTAIVESKLTHLKQLPDGPAMGLYQIEWRTYLDCIRYLVTDEPALKVKILLHTERINFPTTPEAFLADLNLNALIARTKYWMEDEPLPSYKDPQGQAAYYEKYYNANPHNDKTDEFIKANSYCGAWIDEKESQ